MSSKRIKFSDGGGERARIFDFSDPSAVPELLDSINSGKYGSVTKDVEALVARKMQIMNCLYTISPDLEFKSLDTRYDANGEVSGLMSNNVVDLDSLEAKCITPRHDPVLIIESDEEEDVGKKCSLHFEEIALPRPPPTNIELHAQTLRVRFPISVLVQGPIILSINCLLYILQINIEIPFLSLYYLPLSVYSARAFS